MPFRETLLNLAITFVLVLILVLVALLLKQSKTVPVAMPVGKAHTTEQAVKNTAASKPVNTGLPEFKVFPKAKLIDSKNNEADTLRILPAEGEEEGVFTLYFVDAPDMTLTHPQRVQEQARYFEASQEGVMKTGVEATAYVTQLLKERPFMLLTRWEPVPDRTRHYALILVQVGNERIYLADLLMTKGYARLAGLTCELPGEVKGIDDYGAHLFDLGKKAREKKIGVWGRK